MVMSFQVSRGRRRACIMSVPPHQLTNKPDLVRGRDVHHDHDARDVAHPRRAIGERQQDVGARRVAERVEPRDCDGKVGYACEHKRNVHAAHHARDRGGAGERRLDLERNVVPAVLPGRACGGRGGGESASRLVSGGAQGGECGLCAAACAASPRGANRGAPRRAAQRRTANIMVLSPLKTENMRSMGPSPTSGAYTTPGSGAASPARTVAMRQ